MKQPFVFRYKEIDLEYYGWPFIYKHGSMFPLKLSYNGTAGWWVSSNVFLSSRQLKKILNT